MAFQDVGEASDILVTTACPSSITPPVIGHKPVAQTLFPHAYHHGEHAIVDYPGMDENRPKEQAILSMLTTQVAMKIYQRD